MAGNGLQIERIPVLSDNYIWLAHEPRSGVTAVIDPAEAAPVLARAKQKGWRISHILNTHHHKDHVGGNLQIKQETGCIIVGPKQDRARIPGIDIELDDGDAYMLGQERAQVMFVPGHTRGHIAYWFAHSDALFCGDTLFALGCGRLFEGTPGQMWESLRRLRALPDATRVYCAHEYTQSNARFALTIERDNGELKARAQEIDRLRAQGTPTVPSTLAQERATNPFLRADMPSLQAAIGMANASPVDVFAAVRKAKDDFK